MRPALVIAAKDLRQRARDRSALLLAFVAPLLLAAIISNALSGVEAFRVDLGLVAPAGDELAAAFADVLASDELADLVALELFDDHEGAAAAVDDGAVETAVVVPEGFADRVTAGEAAEVAVLARVDDQLAARVAESIVGAFLAQVDANRLSVVAALAAGAPAGSLDELVAAATDRRLPLAVTEQPTGSRPMRAIDYYGPGMAILFAFFTIVFTARSFLDERRDGTLARLAAAPLRPGTIVLGKALSAFVFAGSSLATMWVITTVAFGAHWGEPAAAALLIAAVALAIVALAAFVIGVARTERQADGISSVVVFGFAILGGNFISLADATPALRTLALATPNGWALRGFTDLATGTDDLADVVTPVVAILVFAAAVGGVAAVLAPRAVRR